MIITAYLMLATVLFAGLVQCNRVDLDETEAIPVKVSLKKGGLWRSENRHVFRVNAFGQIFTLYLRPDDSFMAPALRVQRIKAKHLSAVLNDSEPERVLEEILPEPREHQQKLRSCFHTGTVNKDEESLVSVSLCHGIRGTFVTRGREYFIEPVGARSGDARKISSQPHVVKRRVFSRKSGDEDSNHVKHVTDQSDEYEQKAPKRERRFVSAARYIETLVVADASMTRFYGDEIKCPKPSHWMQCWSQAQIKWEGCVRKGIQRKTCAKLVCADQVATPCRHYILTIMGMAAQLYGHPSIKNAVTLVVVKMLVVEDEDVGPEVSRNGGMTLRNFCTWQQHFNPASPRHPEHYDTAILFTREDICGHQNCDTLGVADVGTMCDPKRSCSVIEDNGLQAVFTVSHELGHVLSMPHDDSKTCEKLFGDIDGHHLMAPFFVHLNKTLPWSPCSALYITEFFDNGHGDCLLDVPDKTIPLKAEPPGHMFGVDRQCQQTFGEEFAHCPNAPEDQACIQLWCREEGKLQCTTRNGSLPWADGTPCGEDQSCHEGVCLSSMLTVKENKESVNGGWGAWGAWGPCSRTCGGGVEFSHRECTDPMPQNGGTYCVGQRVKYQSCNIQTCSENHGKSFREEQCEKYNSDRYLNMHGKIKEWIPKYAGVSPRDRCKLFCRARNSNEFKVFEAKVVDGTTCGPDTTSICVQGQCIKAGCDQVIGSNLRLDKCGICGGDGTSCRKISGTLNKAIFGYNDIITIPAGATNIDVKQRSQHGIRHDGNYLAVKAEDETYILNGNFSVSTAELDIPVRGAVLRYSGSSTTLERLLSFQVLQQSITIQLLSTAGDTSPPRVKYSFYLPRELPFSKPDSERSLSTHAILPFGGAEWVLGEWSECSKSCGSGWSRRSVECQDRTGTPTFLCDMELRPTDIRPCGDLPCPVWQMGQWSACSRTCGAGERQRIAMCIDYTGKTVEPEKCNPDKRPEAVSTECFYQDC